MSHSNQPTDVLQPYQPDRSLFSKVRRRSVQWRVVRPLAVDPKRTIVSFTFDDFPRSAADTGAGIVEQFGGRATFYACTGMLGSDGVSGPSFTQDDLAALTRAGHEIGTHTHSHLDCARAPLAMAAQDIDRCEAELATMGLPGLRHFAYPFGETTVPLKKRLSEKVVSARGIAAGINGRGTDLMQLRALELSPEDRTLQRAERAIEVAARSNGWVILFTHDVRDRPSGYGVTPEALRRLGRLARDAGAALLPVGQALDEIMRQTDGR
jgi:peptidoglycan/xylan/chitin deacetylase (PgdA/CDA1 family)